MSDTHGQIFFEESRTLASPYRLGDDPRPLQFAFARLFDEAAQAVYLAGADLDEVLVERILIIRRNHVIQHEIPVDMLADAELLKQSVFKHLAHSADSPEDSVEIVAVKIITRPDALNPK